MLLTCGGQVLILFVYEKQHADPVHHYAKCNRNIYRTAMIVYPTTLGVRRGACVRVVGAQDAELNVPLLHREHQSRLHHCS